MSKKQVSCLGLIVAILIFVSGNVFAQDTMSSEYPTAVIISKTVEVEQTLFGEDAEAVAFSKAEDQVKAEIVSRVSQHVAKLGKDVMVISLGTITRWYLMKEYLFYFHDKKNHQAEVHLNVPGDVFEEFILDNVLPVNMPVFIITDEAGSLQIGDKCPDVHELNEQRGSFE